MIVFTNNINILPHIKNAVICNLSSLNSGYIDITKLITKASYANVSKIPINQYVDTVQFDIDYCNYLFNDCEMFYAFMRIMEFSYEGYSVIILVERDPYRDAIMESLIKLIQSRYGYNCWLCEDIEDALCLKESNFTPAGMVNIIQDIQRADLMTAQGIIQPIFDPNINVGG